MASKGTSVQTYRWNSKLSIRLEYDQNSERQSVFLNNELRSSFHCPVGFRVEHTFRGHDDRSNESGYLGDWKVLFAVEDRTFRIRYELTRRNAGGSDTEWYRYDRNLEDPESWDRFPEFQPGPDIECKCQSCGTIKSCQHCHPVKVDKCDECGEALCCPQCDASELKDLDELDDETLERIGMEDDEDKVEDEDE